MSAGFASPSISMVFCIVISTRPGAFSSTATSTTRLRTRAPAFTGAMKRTLSRP